MTFELALSQHDLIYLLSKEKKKKNYRTKCKTCFYVVIYFKSIPTIKLTFFF